MRGRKDQTTKQRYSTLERSDSKEAGASEKRAKKAEFLFLLFVFLGTQRQSWPNPFSFNKKKKKDLP